MYQSVRFGVNRITFDNFDFGKKTKIFLTSRDEKMVRRTSNLMTHNRKGYRQGTFYSKPEVSTLTGSKVTAHYVVLYIFDDLDLDLWAILFNVMQFRDNVWPN